MADWIDPTPEYRARLRQRESITDRAAGISTDETAQLRAKLRAAANAVNDLSVYLGDHHAPISVDAGNGVAVDVCSCCVHEDGSRVLYPCRTMRLVHDYRRNVLRITDGKVARHG